MPSYRDYDFGSRYGHIRCLREEALKRLPADKVASMADDMICQYFIDEGYIPVVVNTYNDVNETVYLIKQEVLDNAISLER